MSGIYTALRDFMRVHTETIEPTLRQHTPDKRGLCTGCRYSQTRIDSCIFRRAAEDAAKRQRTDQFLKVA